MLDLLVGQEKVVEKELIPLLNTGPFSGLHPDHSSSWVRCGPVLMPVLGPKVVPIKVGLEHEELLIILMMPLLANLTRGGDTLKSELREERHDEVRVEVGMEGKAKVIC